MMILMLGLLVFLQGVVETEGRCFVHSDEGEMVCQDLTPSDQFGDHRIFQNIVRLLGKRWRTPSHISGVMFPDLRFVDLVTTPLSCEDITVPIGVRLRIGDEDCSRKTTKKTLTTIPTTVTTTSNDIKTTSAEVSGSTDTATTRSSATTEHSKSTIEPSKTSTSTTVEPMTAVPEEKSSSQEIRDIILNGLMVIFGTVVVLIKNRIIRLIEKMFDIINQYLDNFNIRQPQQREHQQQEPRIIRRSNRVRRIPDRLTYERF